MPFKTGSWGEQAIARNIRRREYFRNRRRILDGVNNTLGFDAEQEALKLLGIKDKVLRTEGYDIFWRNKKIDVKTDKLSNNHGTWGWLFNCHRQKGKVDYFLCLAKDKDLKTKYIFLIPDKDFSSKNLWVNLKNIEKYHKYLFSPSLVSTMSGEAKS